MAHLNILILGVNRYPRACISAFESFLELFDIVSINVYAGFIVPPDACISNPLSGEMNIRLEDPYGSLWAPYLCCPSFIYEQTEFQGSQYYSCYQAAIQSSLSRMDIFSDNYKSIHNYHHYLFSAFLFALDLRQIIQPGLTLLLRPDVIYSSDEPSAFKQYLSSPVDSSVITLGYDRYGQVNDKFFFSSWPLIKLILQRLICVPRFLLPPWRYFHSETFVRWYLQNQRMKVAYASPALRARRIRSNGQFVDSDSCVYEGCKNSSIFSKNYFREQALYQLWLSLGQRSTQQSIN